MKDMTEARADADTIRALLVHPRMHRVVETWIKPEIDVYYATIGCQRIDFAYPQFLSERGGGVIVDDEAMFKAERPAICWTLGEPCWQPYFGPGLIVGFNPDTGDTTGATVELAEVQAAIRFATPQVQINGKTIYQSVPGNDFLIWSEDLMRFRKVKL